MHHPTDRIVHTTAFVTPVVEHWLEREIAQWVHPMTDRPDDPSHHERTLLPRRERQRERKRDIKRKTETERDRKREREREKERERERERERMREREIEK